MTDTPVNNVPDLVPIDIDDATPLARKHDAIEIDDSDDAWELFLAEWHSHVDFAMALGNMQQNAHRYWVFEHPDTASSWDTNNSVLAMSDREGVRQCRFDQCTMGLVDTHGNPMRKRTRFMTNSPTIIRNFAGRFCKCAPGEHTRIHGSQNGMVLSSLAQQYTSEMCYRLAMSSVGIVVP